MPQSGVPHHFQARHHLVVAVAILLICTGILVRLGMGWRPAGEPQMPSAIELRLDPNTASAEELAAIPGIGLGLAQRIVAYRQRQVAAGQVPVFTTLSDLDAIEGVGPATLETIEPYLALQNPLR